MLLVLLPNQLIQTNIIDDIVNKYTLNKIVLYEHNKFFTKFKYHKSKLIFHRASMKAYYDLLIKTYPKIQVEYVEYTEYVEKQQQQLNKDELEKNRIENAFFKDKKKTNIIL